MRRRSTKRYCLLLICLLMGTSPFALAGERSQNPASQIRSSERHLANIRQLTVGRQNAEAYFSFDGTKLIFQSTNDWSKDSQATTRKPLTAAWGAIRCM